MIGWPVYLKIIFHIRDFNYIQGYFPFEFKSYHLNSDYWIWAIILRETLILLLPATMRQHVPSTPLTLVKDPYGTLQHFNTSMLYWYIFRIEPAIYLSDLTFTTYHNFINLFATKYYFIMIWTQIFGSNIINYLSGNVVYTC